jgi:hypothetical protein
MVIEAVLQAAGPMLLELLIREVAAPAAKRLLRTSEVVAAEQAPHVRDLATPQLSAVRAVQVVSQVPGRVRVEVAGLRGQHELARTLSDGVTGLTGVSRTEASAQTGRLLVHFDPTRQSVQTLVAAIDRSRARHLNRSGSRTRRLAAVV